jgi:hypothetical protein
MTFLVIITVLAYLLMVLDFGCRLGRFMKKCDEDAKEIMKKK